MAYEYTNHTSFLASAEKAAIFYLANVAKGVRAQRWPPLLLKEST